MLYMAFTLAPLIIGAAGAKMGMFDQEHVDRGQRQEFRTFMDTHERVRG